VIIGAGLTGIGAAVHVQRECPRKQVVVLEARAAMGGTWDLFRYPGIRSDSDMFTLGYKFKPWTQAKSIADGADICRYIRETAVEYGIDRKIRYQHKVMSLDWSSRKARWVVTVRREDTGETLSLESRFVMCCAGYYRYDSGFTPDFPGRQDFTGTLIHPQHWPENFDYSGKRVVVIGSGATAMTLVPAMAGKAAHVTMLQRSPTYVASLPGKDALPQRLRKVLPERAVYAATRTRNVLFSWGFYHFSRAYPDLTREFLLDRVRKQVGSHVDMQHFTPRYKPWDERLCAVPDGDLFKTLRQGRASVVTDHIERFTPEGILLKSGRTLEADVIVTATGLQIQVLGGMQLTLDGAPVKIPEKRYYKGAMLEDVPNLVMIFGYTNSSWTLKADLIAEYFCRVMKHMESRRFTQCAPRHRGDSGASQPFLDLSAGYVQRALAQLPRQGDKAPWKMYQNYFRDYAMLKLGKVDDNTLEFSRTHRQGRGEHAGAAPAVAGALH
jgi:cation diffusion facilitator CzcD-associated flavoprotein CzcO